MKPNALDQLESRLQALIEVHLVDLLPGRLSEDMIAQQLSQAVKANLTVLPDGSRQAPNRYALTAHPDVVAQWNANPRILSGLIEILKTAAGEMGLHFPSDPRVILQADTALQPEEIHVTASHESGAMGETHAQPKAEETEEGGNLPENAFLIVEGVKVFPLTRSVVNIGRRLDNQLVIEDPRVSRNHAQLRAIKGRYVLFDLNSTGGTYVNGQRVTQSVLYPGDVISLAGVPLIFGQDNPPPRPDLADTSPLSPAAGDRPTAILKKSDEPGKKT